MANVTVQTEALLGADSLQPIVRASLLSTVFHVGHAAEMFILSPKHSFVSLSSGQNDTVGHGDLVADTDPGGAKGGVLV